MSVQKDALWSWGFRLDRWRRAELVMGWTLAISGADSKRVRNDQTKKAASSAAFVPILSNYGALSEWPVVWLLLPPTPTAIAIAVRAAKPATAPPLNPEAPPTPVEPFTTEPLR